MELEDLVDKYRSSTRLTKGLLIIFSGLLPALYLWVNEAESLEFRRNQVETEVAQERAKFEAARQKTAELPALLSKLTSIEEDLKKAKLILPDTIAVDSILGELGKLEKELNVKLVRFTPGQEVQPNPQLEYREVPIDLVLNASFAHTMRFLDRLVHMPNLTHIRNIQFSQASRSIEKPGSSPELETNAKLILFKGM